MQTEPGVLVHSTADRHLAVEQWLLSAARDRELARQEWTDRGVALLSLGGIMSAVRLPGRLVLPLTDADTAPSRDVDAFLAEVLGGGPVICDPRSLAYYCLVPAGTPHAWQDATPAWAPLEVGVLGRDAHLGVPRADCTGPDSFSPYWAVPMPSMGVLCEPTLVARLIERAAFAALLDHSVLCPNCKPTGTGPACPGTLEGLRKAMSRAHRVVRPV
ncbi:hypothetical protein [Streptomyces sp. NPDC018960]|uniref:hypothetical protein n=1 Tax=unclassified Streptomyces TaxID=2593676 RepID=UPI0037AE0F2F